MLVVECVGSKGVATVNYGYSSNGAVETWFQVSCFEYLLIRYWRLIVIGASVDRPVAALSLGAHTRWGSTVWQVPIEVMMESL